MIDPDRAARIVGGEDAALAVHEHRLGNGEIALLDADAGAIAVGHAQIAEDESFHPRAAPAQHKRRLALASRAVEDRASRFGGDEGDLAGFLHRALGVAARRDANRAGAVADRGHRSLEIGKAAARFDDGERARALRSGRGGEGKEEDGEAAFHGLRNTGSRLTPQPG